MRMSPERVLHKDKRKVRVQKCNDLGSLLVREVKWLLLLITVVENNLKVNVESVRNNCTRLTLNSDLGRI